MTRHQERLTWSTSYHLEPAPYREDATPCVACCLWCDGPARACACVHVHVHVRAPVHVRVCTCMCVRRAVVVTPRNVAIHCGGQAKPWTGSCVLELREKKPQLGLLARPEVMG